MATRRTQRAASSDGDVGEHAGVIEQDAAAVQPAPAAKPRGSGSRGPHAERTAAMRKRLIDAAIECLNERGYRATTLQNVTDKAEVSRGAILHHFPTKPDLMIAVAEYAAGKQNRHVARLLADVPEGMDRYMAITMATWDAMTRPPSVALIEIMIGSRSDPELSDRFPAVIEALETFQAEGVWEQAQSVGIRSREDIQAMTWLHNAAMRGLVIDLMFSRRADRAASAMQLLVKYKEMLTAALARPE